MPVFGGDLGIPNLTLIDRPYLKPAQTFIITIKNYQAKTGASNYRLSEVSFYGNEPDMCSDADKICNPNKKILGLKVYCDYTNNTFIYLVLGEYFGYTTEQNILLETSNISVGTNLKFTVQIGGGKIIIKRGDTVLISTSYSQKDPIVNAVYYRVADVNSPTWGNAMTSNLAGNVAKEIWNIEYGTMGFGFDIGKLISSIFPLIVLGSLIPALVGLKGKGKG